MMENAIRIIKEGAEQVLKPTEFISREILRFKTSKEYKAMLNGYNYFEGRHDILRKQRTAIGEGGQTMVLTNLPNSRQVDNQYKKCVKQKVNYLVGKPFSIQTDNKIYSKALENVFDKRFFATMKNITKDAYNAGLGWLYVYYDEQGNLNFKRFRPWECIPGWTDADHTQLEYMIRFYNVDVFDGKKESKLTKVEYYTTQGIDYFNYYNGTLVPCEPWHTDYLTVGNVSMNWERMPFIAFKYNDEEIPLICNCKSLQDGLNNIISNFQDNMEEDPRNTILVLVNYDGENLGEFRRNLATYGVVKVKSVDGVAGDLRTLQVEVNASNYKAIIDVFRKAIIENCMCYDAKDERMSGTPNQMNIQSMYNDIDLDASDTETEFQAALDELLWFIDVHFANTGTGDFSKENVDFIFNTDMPMDEGSTIENIQKSVGILSTETLIAQHPWVTDAEREMKRLEEEKQKQIDQYSNAFATDNAQNGSNTSENV